MLYSSECLSINKFRLPTVKTSLDSDIIIMIYQGKIYLFFPVTRKMDMLLFFKTFNMYYRSPSNKYFKGQLRRVVRKKQYHNQQGDHSTYFSHSPWLPTTVKVLFSISKRLMNTSNQFLSLTLTYYYRPPDIVVVVVVGSQLRTIRLPDDQLIWTPVVSPIKKKYSKSITSNMSKNSYLSMHKRQIYHVINY